MVTYVELAQEPWWGQETVSAAMDRTGDRWRSHWQVGLSVIGCKGDNNHLRGRHRSRDWTRNSIHCTSRSYGDTDQRDRAAPTDPFGRYLRAYDLDGMPAEERYAFNRRLDQAVRDGLLPCVAEWWGTFDGQTVVGWYQGHPDASADDSHLEHTHIGIWLTFCEDDAQLALLGDIILGVDMADPAADGAYAILRHGLRTADVPVTLLPAGQQTSGGGRPTNYLGGRFWDMDRRFDALDQKMIALMAKVNALDAKANAAAESNARIEAKLDLVLAALANGGGSGIASGKGEFTFTTTPPEL